MDKKITATIFIPTFNGDQYLEELLNQVSKQKNVTFEILIIDSGSNDNTLSIIKQFPKVKLHQIPNNEFGHGKTRNMAASIAKGKYIIYLSQDAIPVHDRWLEFMIEPFYLSDKIYCVFGKQIPRPFADAPTKREVYSVFKSLGPDHSIMIHRKKSLVTKIETTPYLTFFSDVNSAVRKDYITKIIPYKDVRYSEDQLLGEDVLNSNYLKVYTPKGSVWHSNEYGLRDYFRRKYDEYMGMYEVMKITPPGGRKNLIKTPIVNTFHDLIFITRDNDYSILSKFRNYISSPIRNSLRSYAAYLVANPIYREKHGLKHSLENKNKSI